MAEFQEVCKQWRRLCMSFEDKAAKDYRPCAELCPVGCNPVCGELCESTQEDVERFEAAVMAWAAEHPEPVYPTWEKYLADLMMLDMMCGKTDNPNSVENYMRKTPIPIEIAQKLGIEPKEGT